jgi:hypothetical protein
MMVYANFLKLDVECPHDIRRYTLQWALWMQTEGKKRRFQVDLLNGWIADQLAGEARTMQRESEKAGAA